MERKVGETFNFKDMKLCVKKALHPVFQCKECYFDKTIIDCVIYADQIGVCSAVSRHDNQDIVFVEVKEN